ncbi:MAG TPA: IS256 family transposase [Gemmatimonadaceae bacterium]|nr:IS256 family transposase [Gemmatimonadaceae bacterium]
MATHRKGGTPGVTFDPAALEALLGDARTPAEVDELFRQMKKALMERILAGELTHHLGYAPGEAKPPEQANQRNGTTPKTVLTEDGAVPLAVPRDRAGTFEPQLVPKHVRRLPRFDQNVLSLYARGLTVREIQGHLEELYQVAVSPEMISTVTDAVLGEVSLWQQRALDACYPVVIFDAMRVKIREEGVVRTKAVYLALGIRASGHKDVLGLWIEQTEGAAFWHRVLTELANRGVSDILIALVDGLAGFPEAIAAVFPETQVHQCVVHLVRRSLTFVAWKDRKAVVALLRRIYRAPSLAAADAALGEFEQSPWAEKYPTIAPLWRRSWVYVMPLFQYPLPIRRLLSTTNAIESLNMQLRKIIKTRGHFPTDAAALKLLFLALRNATKKWRNISREWIAAMPHFVVLFGERFTPSAE